MQPARVAFVPAARLVLAAALACALLLVAALVPGPAGAVACVVNSTADSGAGTLREKVNDATCDSITFTLPNPSTITLTTGQLAISRNLTITGPGAAALTVSGNNASRVFFVTGGTVAISGLTVAGGNASGENGGGILVVFSGSLSLEQLVVRNNTAGFTGGGVVTQGRPLTVTNSVVRDNDAGLYGGGIGVIAAGSLELHGSTMSGNQAAAAGGGVSVENGSTATITNSTIAGNSAGAVGAGLLAFGNGATMTLAHVTVSGNTGSSQAVYTENTGSVHVKATIIANGITNCSGTIVNDGYNVDSAATCGFGSSNGSISNASSLLAPLGDYGGATQTMPLLPGSPAINLVPSADCATVTADQRGVARPQPTGAACDSGAFESRGFAMSLVDGNNQSADINTAFANPIRVEVTSAFGEPVEGGRVTFTGPGSGAGIQDSPLSSGIIDNGRAGVTPTANGTGGGPYTVAASAAGVATGVNFSLTNRIPTTLVAADASGVYGGTVALSATLTATSGGASVSGKTIAFTLNGSPVGAAVTNDSGVATLSDVPLGTIATGPYATGVGASFAADSTHAASSDTAQLTVTKAASSVTNVTVSSPSVVYGTAGVTLGATVSNTSNAAALTGGSLTIRITDAADTVTYCTDTVGPVAGGATYPTSGLICTFATFPPVGTATIRASYAGDANFQGSAGTGSLTVTKASTGTTIGAIIPTPACGDPTVTVPVTVGNTSNDAPLTGGTATVTIKQGSTVFGTGTAPVSGADPVTVNVIVPVAALGAGSYTVEAGYGGDANFLASLAAPGTLTVVQAATTVTVPTAVATYGDASVTLVAAVTSANGAALNGGTVTFVVKRGTQTLATLTSAPVVGASPATASVTLTLDATYAARNYTIEASYGGNGCFVAADSSGTLQVKRRIIVVKPVDRTVVLRQPNPPAAPPADCLAVQTPTSACWLELADGSSFAHGDDWSDLGVFPARGAGLRFLYSRNYPQSNPTEFIGKTYRIAAAGLGSANYDIRYLSGTLTVAAPTTP